MKNQLMSLVKNALYACSILFSISLLGQNANGEFSFEVVGDSVLGGVNILNVAGDGINIFDTTGYMLDGVQVIFPNDDGIYVFSPGDDGFQVISAGGDGFYSQLSNDDGFQSVDAGGDGIFTTNSGGFAGYFGGNVEVTGSLTKAAGSFKIDHPLDPENKILYHSFVESSDMMNIYNGNVVLDKNGNATILLPDWFCALNKDYRYQLTCIGGFSQVYVSKKVEGNKFSIAGGNEGLEVSWQVTGIRNDAYAQKFRIPVEVDKDPKFKGQYLQPEAYNLPYEKGYDYLKLKDDKPEGK